MNKPLAHPVDPLRRQDEDAVERFLADNRDEIGALLEEAYAEAAAVR